MIKDSSTNQLELKNSKQNWERSLLARGCSLIVLTCSANHRHRIHQSIYLNSSIRLFICKNKHITVRQFSNDLSLRSGNALSQIHSGRSSFACTCRPTCVLYWYAQWPPRSRLFDSVLPSLSFSNHNSGWLSGHAEGCIHAWYRRSARGFHFGAVLCRLVPGFAIWVSPIAYEKRSRQKKKQFFSRARGRGSLHAIIDPNRWSRGEYC